MSAREQRKALVIGISDYIHLEKLDFCKNDGKEVYGALRALGYNISDNNKLVGEAEGQKVKDAIYDFFDDVKNSPDDTLLFYYSGHGVPDVDGDMYLASSDTDPDKPYRRGFSLEDLTKMIQNSISTRVVVILDCCYSGSAKLSKGHEEDAAKIGRTAIDEKTRKLTQGQGKYILSASQAAQEAYALTTGEHSIFTYYLLEGLKGKTDSVDNEGNVTPQSLGNYIYRAIMSLPVDRRPKQRPITKAEESGNVILASHPELKPVPKEPTPVAASIPAKQGKQKYQFLERNKYLLLIPIVIAAIVGIVLAGLFGFLHPVNHSYNVTSVRFNDGSNNGTQAAFADMQNGRLFNPSCDPTGAHTVGGQHPTAFCTGWTTSYISTWNAKHPGWTNGYISAWQPNRPPANGSVLSCQQCGSKLKPIIRYINGSNDGSQTAISNIQAAMPFNPACDPTASHTSDRLHTTHYCNGWTTGYISTWNAKHISSTIQPESPSLVQNVRSPIPLSNVNSTKVSSPTFTHLSLTCKKNTNNTLICTYSNSTSSQKTTK
jgi:hypothetical protein